MISKTSTIAPPSTQEISSLLTSIFSAKTSQEALDGSYRLTDLLLGSVGFRGLDGYGVLQEVKKAANDKKDGAKRESAMLILGAFFEKFPPAQRISEVVFLIHNGGVVNVALDALADKGAVVRDAAQYALDALFENLQAEALVVGLLPVLSRYLRTRTGKWQGSVGGYKLLGRMADKAKIGIGSKEEEKNKDILRETMGKKLAELIPIVETGMHDLKSDVCSVRRVSEYEEPG